MLKLKWTLLTLAIAAASAHAAEADKTLDLLHAAGDKVQSLGADVEMKSVDKGTQAETIDRGKIVMQRLPDGDTRARITFIDRIVDERLKKSHREFLLDGGVLIEQNHDTRKQVTRQLRRPGEKIDLFKLGQGPFPMPIGQTKESVHEQFDVSAPGEHVVKLTPKESTSLKDKFQSITVTVDPALGVPTVIETLSVSGEETKTVTLKNVRLNEAVQPEEFKLPPADPKVWELVSE